MKNNRILQVVFAIPWIAFGILHFLYADFVATLVPAFMPFKLFWTYFTGTAMIAAGISFLLNKFSSLAANLLGLMLTGFILLIHVPQLAIGFGDVNSWTRPLQDIALACACFIFANALSPNGISGKIASVSRYVFAAAIIGFGVQQIFFETKFVTASIPGFFPARMFWFYLTAIVMFASAASIIINKKARLTTFILGILLLVINLSNYAFLLFADLSNAQVWTAAMVVWAVTVGVFILANSLSNGD